ncbi:MAG: TadE/TadG family protein [Rhizobiaceae bacterium]|nr:TadE/TadG family protein [Rhizobiaceae bacterium]
MWKVTQLFLRRTGGNFAIGAGVLAIPLIFAAGLMVDMTTVSRSQNELQQAMDAAVLAVAREGERLTQKEAIEIARTYLEENYDLVFGNLTVTRDGTKVTIDATAETPTAFGGLLGYSDWTVEARSTADIAFASYEVALVLDTTGSMAGGKLTAMKEAVDGMIESMSAQIKDKDRLKFSLVPFATFVNVGPEYGPKFDKNGAQIAGTGAKWLDLNGGSPVPQSELTPGVSRFQLYENLGKRWPGCVETRYRGGRNYDVDDTKADQKRPETLFVPAFSIDEPDTKEYVNSYVKSKVDIMDTSTKAKKQKWAKYGVATDRFGNPLNGGLLSGILKGLGLGGDDDDEDDDEDDDDDRRSYKAKLKKKIEIDDSSSGYQDFKKGPDFGCGAQPITPLSSDYDDIVRKVKRLRAQGNTNIMEGVSWGMRVLTPGEPFGEGKSIDDPRIEKIMVVLTDGANRFGVDRNPLGSKYSSNGYLVDERLGRLLPSNSSVTPAMNDRTLAACNYAKELGIEIYTIRLEEPDKATGNLLQQCASSEGHFFDAPSRRQLDEVFEEIGKRVVKLRLAS